MTVTAFMIPGCLRCNKENVPIRITDLIGEFILITYVEISLKHSHCIPGLVLNLDPWKWGCGWRKSEDSSKLKAVSRDSIIPGVTFIAPGPLC